MSQSAGQEERFKQKTLHEVCVRDEKGWWARDTDSHTHRNQVMYAETLESIPPDLMTDWVMMICPVGKRCLVTSGNGQTVARARSGKGIHA